MQLERFGVDELKRKHFLTLLNLGSLLFPLVAVADFVTNNLVSAQLESVLAICFLIARWLVQNNYYVNQSMMLIILLGCLGLSWYDSMTLFWVPVLTVIGFGLLGIEKGRLWAMLTIFCVTVLFIFDLISSSPTYTALIAMNSVVSGMTLAFIVDYAYRQLQKNHEQFLQETAKKDRLVLSKRFSENMSHLINNEMQGVIGFAEMMQFEVQDETLRSYCEQIILSAEKTSMHANQLNTFAEKAQGDLKLFDFQVLVESVVQTWRETLPQLYVHMNWETGALTCKGDAHSLKDVLLCLLDNANEAIERAHNEHQGQIEVELERVVLHESGAAQRLPEGEYVVLSIVDNGCGVPPEMQDNLFEPFVTTEFLGRGLGLAQALGKVKQHSGDIELHATSNAGSVFRVWLPLETRALESMNKAGVLELGT
ncbi:MAG: HAMP domain-containing sensor histidine kinase [Ghiorsea sp.]|nr:HAMP domain-containing sensor histidine kinase [Ghiorsea sp.]